MKYLNQEIENELRNQGAELIRFVDISHLSETQNRQFPHAIVFALPLTAGYIKEVCDTPDYVQARIDDNYNFDDDEYSITENRTHKLADNMAAYIAEKGYNAFSQSDENLIAEGKFDAAHNLIHYHGKCERHPQMVGVSMKTLTLSMIMYKVMCCIKFKITAQ